MPDFVWSKPVAHQRRFIVAEERRHQRRSRSVGVLRNPPRQGHRVSRCRHHQFLPSLQAKPNIHCHLSKQVQFFCMRAFVHPWFTPTHRFLRFGTRSKLDRLASGNLSSL
jgi:hypothetical protein